MPSARRFCTHRRLSNRSGRYVINSRSGTESRTVIHPTNQLRVKGLRTYIRSASSGINRDSENAFLEESLSTAEELEAWSMSTPIEYDSSVLKRLRSGSWTYTEADSATMSRRRRSSYVYLRQYRIPNHLG